MADESGFLARWSQRKAQVRRGVEPAPEPAGDLAPAPAPAQPLPAPAPAAQGQPAAAAAEGPPPPTLADVEQLGADADYTRFVARDVDEGVRRAALKKLFAEPHFNVMDGLDTYIDDYGKPDPLPAHWLRQMTQARAIGLFADEEPSDSPADDAPAPPQPDRVDEDTDLRLQPNDAAGRPDAEPGAQPDAGRER